MTAKSLLKLLGLVLLLILIGAGFAYIILWWVVIVWTFNVNALWGVIVFLIWTVLHGGGLAASRRT